MMIYLRMVKSLVKITNKFLELTDNKILQTAGSISHELAIAKANEEYDKFKVNPK